GGLSESHQFSTARSEAFRLSERQCDEALRILDRSLQSVAPHPASPHPQIFSLRSRFHMFLRFLALLCLALSLCACGGGSGSATSNQNANGSHAVVVTRVSPSNLSSATSPVNFDFKASSQTPIKGW